MTAPLEADKGVAWLPDTPEGEQALSVFLSEQDAMAAALESEGCEQPLIWEMDERPSWWSDDVHGPWSPGFLLGCQTTGIVFPTLPIALAMLAELLWPDAWGPAPPV